MAPTDSDAKKRSGPKSRLFHTRHLFDSGLTVTFRCPSSLGGEEWGPQYFDLRERKTHTIKEG